MIKPSILTIISIFNRTLQEDKTEIIEVKRRNRNEPYCFSLKIGKNHSISLKFKILSFDAVETDPAAFDVPNICKSSKLSFESNES